MSASRKVRKKSVVASKQQQPRQSTVATEIEQLAEVLRKHDLSEIEVEQGDVRIRVRRGGVTNGVMEYHAPAAHHAPPPPAPAPTPAGAASGGSAETSDGNISYITSPFVGTFYRSPNPDQAPFVDVGTHVRKGQVMCIVEAMKLMNEIEAEVEGTIVQILVENGQPVEYGEPLFKIKQG